MKIIGCILFAIEGFITGSVAAVALWIALFGGKVSIQLGDPFRYFR